MGSKSVWYVHTYVVIGKGGRFSYKQVQDVRTDCHSRSAGESGGNEKCTEKSVMWRDRAD